MSDTNRRVVCFTTFIMLCVGAPQLGEVLGELGTLLIAATTIYVVG